MKKRTECLIKKVISEIKQEYNYIVIDYDYNEEYDEYEVWHNSKKLQFEDKDFLYKNDLFNISFGYDGMKFMDYIDI